MPGKAGKAGKAVSRVIGLLAEVLSGTQVPRSLGTLGAATEPWDELRKELGWFGWSNSEEIEAKLRTVLREIPDGDSDGRGSGSEAEQAVHGRAAAGGAVSQVQPDGAVPGVREEAEGYVDDAVRVLRA